MEFQEPCCIISEANCKLTRATPQNIYGRWLPCGRIRRGGAGSLVAQHRPDVGWRLRSRAAGISCPCQAMAVFLSFFFITVFTFCDTFFSTRPRVQAARAATCVRQFNFRSVFAASRPTATWMEGRDVLQRGGPVLFLIATLHQDLLKTSSWRPRPPLTQRCILSNCLLIK